MRKHHHVGRRDTVLHFSPYFLDYFDRVSGVVGQVDVEAIISVAELGEEVKNRLSHRAKALEQLKRRLEEIRTQ